MNLDRNSKRYSSLSAHSDSAWTFHDSQSDYDLLTSLVSMMQLSYRGSPFQEAVDCH